MRHETPEKDYQIASKEVTGFTVNEAPAITKKKAAISKSSPNRNSNKNTVKQSINHEVLSGNSVNMF